MRNEKGNETVTYDNYSEGYIKIVHLIHQQK